MTTTRHLAGGRPHNAGKNPWLPLIPILVVMSANAVLAEDGNKPVALKRVAPPPAPLKLVELLPADASAVVFAPRLAQVLTDLDQLNRSLSPLHPEWGAAGLHGVLLKALRGGPDLMGKQVHPLAGLFTKEGLVDAGIDPMGPLVALPDFQARVLIVSVELVDRPQFERWLARVDGWARQRIDIAGEVATVLEPRGRMPVTCLARRNYAMCQLGAAPDGDAIQPLRRLVALRGPRLGRATGPLPRALRSVAPGAHVIAVADSKRLTPQLARLLSEWEDQTHRFLEPARRQEALAQAAHLRRKLEATARFTDAIAAGLYANPQTMEVRAFAHLTRFGRATLAWWLPPRRSEDVIDRWTRTPALMRLAARVRPEVLEGVAMSFGVTLPKDALTGDVGLLSMGLDALCSLALRKHERTTGDSSHWAFVFPTALAIGLRSDQAADQIREAAARRLQAALPAAKAGLAMAGPVSLGGDFHGNPYKVQVVNRLLVLGMGPGIGSAAVRRLGALPPSSPRKSVVGPFLDVTFNPRAIDAAFTAANIGPQHRTDLQALERWRLRWSPLLTRLREVRLVAALDKKRGRLAVSAGVAR